MRLTRTVFAALAALLLLPAAALAQAGPGDRYQDPIVLGTSSQPLPITPAVVGFNVDTTNYTTQDGDPIFGGGPEFNACGQSAYGKTAWSIFYTNRTGRVDITAAGFDAVIGLASFASPQNAVPAGGPCVDRRSGNIESFPRDNLPTVQKGGWYAIQVGGYQGQGGAFAGGPLEVNVELLPPEQLIADAGLTWKSTRGGVKVTSVRVDGPQGSVAAIGCIRKKCGRDQTVRNPKPVGVFSRTLAKVDPSSTGKKLEPAKASDAPVRMATKNVFKGRTIPNGGRLAVVVLSQNADQIGQIFFWDVRNNAAGAKNIQCVEPDGKKFRAQGKCTGA
jgi:hypothetical protein